MAETTLEAIEPILNESPLPVAIPSIPVPFINEANARELQVKSVESRRRKTALLLSQEPEEQPPQQPDDYAALQLARVREHIARVDCRLDKATDPLDIDRLARARGSLAEQARILAGVPLPGALRPSAPRTARKTGLEPV